MNKERDYTGCDRDDYGIANPYKPEDDPRNEREKAFAAGFMSIRDYLGSTEPKGA